MKNTIISRKDKNLLEEVILKYGRIVTFNQLKEVFQKLYDSAETKNRVSLLSKIGWLLRIKKALYIVVTDIIALDSNDISEFTIAQSLNPDSYVSFENALQHHSMFDQMLSSVGAITYKRARTYEFKNTKIKFYKINKKLYFGFKEERSDIGLIKIADKEKAILDILYFFSDFYHASLVWEKIKEHKHDLDFDLLKQYSKKFNLNIVRQIGFFLDRIGINTSDLLSLVKNKNSYGKMASVAKKFDAKWRLYYDDRVIQ